MRLVRQPAAVLLPFVETLWTIEGAGSPNVARAGRERVLPSGAMSLAFRLDDTRFRFFGSPEERVARPVGSAVVGGARRRAYLKEMPPGARSVGALLRPGAAELLLGVPAEKLAGRHTSLDDLWGRAGAEELRERLAGETDAESRLALFESLLAARLPAVRGIHPAVAHALGRLDGPVEIAEVVRETGFSHRRFIALFRRAAGVAPKVYSRLRRFQRVLRRLAAEPQVSGVELALGAGYGDQAHLHRDFREFAEMTPGEYRRSRPERPGHVVCVRPGKGGWCASLAAWLVATGLSACSAAPSEPRAEARLQRLDAVATAAVETGLPGAVVAVIAADGTVRTGAAGLADRRSGEAMTPGSQVHAASTTKAVTAAAALILVDRGQLALDRRLPELLSEPILDGVPYAAEITVRDLLLHTSGLYSPNNDPVYLRRYIGAERLDQPFWRPEEVVAFAADPSRPPAFAPGEGQSYGDINYVLLGLIVEAVDGRPLKAFVRQEILDPLGMEDTWYLSDSPAKRRARAYTVDSDVLRQIGLDPGLKADEDGFIDTTDAQEQSDGAAGLITSMPDLARFAHALTLGGLLSESSRALILEVAEHARPPDQGEALGVLRAYEMPYGTIVTAEGDGPGTNVVWALHLDSRAVVAAAVNQFGRWDESDQLLGAVIPAALEASASGGAELSR